MTALTVGVDPPTFGQRSATSAVQAWALTKRSVLAIYRNPAMWIPGMLFPLGLAAIYAAQFQRVLGLPGFPEVDSFLQFILPASIMQAVAFGVTNGGTDLAKDIETGFFDRLMASPVSRMSVLVGRIGGAAVFAAFQAVLMMSIFLVFGAPVRSGLPGAIAIVIVAVVFAIALGGFGLALALRTGSQEATQSTFPLVFVMLFVSSAFFPTELMRGWYQDVAEVNPVTWLIDPTRRLVVEGWSWGDLGQALAVELAIAVVSLSLAYRQYVRRLRRA